MTLIKGIEQKIEEHKDLMNQLINEEKVLTDPQLVETSQKLDVLLNEYDSLLD